VLTGKRWVKKSPIDAGLFISLVHEASLREPCLPAPPVAVGRVNVIYMAANPPCCARRMMAGARRAWGAMQMAG
jgi:hypothetical protein